MKSLKGNNIICIGIIVIALSSCLFPELDFAQKGCVVGTGIVLCGIVKVLNHIDNKF